MRIRWLRELCFILNFFAPACALWAVSLSLQQADWFSIVVMCCAISAYVTLLAIMEFLLLEVTNEGPPPKRKAYPFKNDASQECDALFYL